MSRIFLMLGLTIVSLEALAQNPGAARASRVQVIYENTDSASSPKGSTDSQNPMCNADLFIQNKAKPFKCDADSSTMEALKVQIARNICLKKMDIPCLREMTEKFDTLECSKLEVLRTGDYWKSSTSTDCIANHSKNFAGSYAESVYNKWKTSDSELRLTTNDVHRRGAPKDKSKDEVAAMIDMISNGVSVIPAPSSPLLSIPFELVKAVLSDKTTEQEIGTGECGFVSINVGALKTKNGTCLPSFSIQQPAVRTLLNQNSEYQDRALSCQNTCHYYVLMLASLTTYNDFLIRKYSDNLTTPPMCNKDGSYSFKYSAEEPAAPRDAAEKLRGSQGLGRPGGASILNPQTGWTVNVKPDSKETVISMSPDQMSPELVGENFDRLKLTYDKPTNGKKGWRESKPPVVQVISGPRARTAPIRPGIGDVESSDRKVERRQAMIGGLLLSARVGKCCLSQDSAKCMADTGYFPMAGYEGSGSSHNSNPKLVAPEKAVD